MYVSCARAPQLVVFLGGGEILCQRQLALHKQSTLRSKKRSMLLWDKFREANHQLYLARTPATPHAANHIRQTKCMMILLDATTVYTPTSLEMSPVWSFPRWVTAWKFSFVVQRSASILHNQGECRDCLHAGVNTT